MPCMGWPHGHYPDVSGRVPSFKRDLGDQDVIQPNPRAEEPRVGVGQSNMAAGQLLVSEPPVTACCKTIVIFGEAPPSAGLKYSCSGHRPKGCPVPE